MNVIMPQLDDRNYDKRYRDRPHLFTAGMTDAYQIYVENREINIGVYPVTGTARAEVTISSMTDIKNDIAVWMPWPAGDVTVNTVDILLHNVCAVRFITTGEADFEFSAI